jgi:hypothetical protein
MEADIGYNRWFLIAWVMWFDNIE